MARVRITGDANGRANVVDTSNLKDDPNQVDALLVRNQPSIEINRNSKGYNYSIKVFADTADEAAEKAIALAKRIDKEFKISND